MDRRARLGIRGATFEAGARLLAEEVVELVADGLDTVATVRLNGSEVARTENMFIGRRWDVKPLLRAGRNKLSIRFASASRYIRTERTGHRPREINDPVGGCTVIRKEQCQFGWDWGPRFVTAGIWRDLRLEGWTGNRLDSVRVTQEHRATATWCCSSPPNWPGPTKPCDRWRTVPAARGRFRDRKWPDENRRPPTLVVPRPGRPALYQLEVEVTAADGTPIGRWTRRIGLRTIVLDRQADQWGRLVSVRRQRPARFRQGRQLDSRAQFCRRTDPRRL